MTGAYYNENDPVAAEWLRELIKARHIAHGIVDERSITEVRAYDLQGFTQCHFFAGIGGWSHALRLAGWPDYKPVWTGSCPCQPFSASGKRRGFEDERHLWPEFFRLIRELRPAVVFGEQVAGSDGLRWLDAVSTDLESEDYAIGAADIGAAGVGAPHARQRLYWVADSSSERHARERVLLWPAPAERLPSDLSEAAGSGKTGGFWTGADWLPCADGQQRPVEPGTFPLAHGIPSRVGRLRGYGNAIVPQVAATFITAYEETRR